MSVQPLQRPKRTPKVKQACDCCHARKIKCDGTSPCNNCHITDLQCTYLSVHKKKGPKGPSKRTPRAILKMQMEQKNNPPEPPSVDPSESSTYSPPPLDLNIAYHYPGSRFEPSPLLTLSLVERFAESYFKHKYPLTPILHKGDFYAALPYFRSSPEQYALIASLCAAVLTQVNSDQQGVFPPDVSTVPLTTDFFISEARRARTVRDYVEWPTLQDVQTSFFIFAGLFDRDRHNSAWFHLREAITLMEALRLHEEETYAAMPARQALFSRRTFWLLFVTERAYALQRHRPLSLDCSAIALPPLADPADPDADIIAGFLDLVALFRNFTADFVATWNAAARAPTLPFAAARPNPSISSAQLAALQDILALAAPATSTRTEIQQADLSITRLWLSTMTWQLCVSQGLLSSCPRTSPALSFHYPIALAARLAAVCAPLHREAFDANGPGILEKIFDVGCSLVDVLVLQPGGPGVGMHVGTAVDAMHVGPREYLAEMLRVMGMAMGGSSKYLAMLGEKAGEALRTGPPRAVEVGADDDRAGEGRGGVWDAQYYAGSGVCGAGGAWLGGVDAAAGPGGEGELFYRE